MRMIYMATQTIQFRGARAQLTLSGGSLNLEKLGLGRSESEPASGPQE
jgi:hypothetical protein